MGGLLFLAIWVAPLWPDSEVAFRAAFAAVGVTLIAANARSHPISRRTAGIRVDNLFRSAAVFLTATAVLLSLVIAWTAGEVALRFPIFELPSYFVWALFQQLVAVGAFWLPLRAYFHESEEKAAIAVGLVFSLAHAPNPGLMGFGLVAESAWLLLYSRYRNLFALSLAHAFGALVVGHQLVPSAWLPSMTVGLAYFR